MRFLLCLLGLITSSVAFGQRSFFGATAGVNLANQKITSLSSSFTTRPSFGVFYQFGFTEKFAARLNAQYMGMGYSNGPLGDVSINYLTFPLTLHYAAAEKLSFHAGAYVSFTLGGTNINNQEIIKTYHKNDNGFCFGSEYDVTSRFAIGLTYYLGTKNVWLDDQGGTIEFTNQAFQLLLIYKFKKQNN